MDALRGRHVTVVEVGPRDGLQNEPALISTADKIEFINRLTAANLPAICSDAAPSELARTTTVNLSSG